MLASLLGGARAVVGNLDGDVVRLALGGDRDARRAGLGGVLCEVAQDAEELRAVGLDAPEVTDEKGEPVPLGAAPVAGAYLLVLAVLLLAAGVAWD